MRQFLLAEISKTDAFAGLNRILFNTVLFGVFIAALAIIFGVVFSRSITPWKRISVVDSIREKTHFDVLKMSEKELKNKAEVLGHRFDPKVEPNRGELIMTIFDLTVSDHLWDPTFIVDFPVEISPLTKIHRTKPGFVERFEPYIAGMELGNAYSELNDPEDQRKRLEEQEASRTTNEEAYRMDEDFMHAIDVGMPPTGGVGLGIERLVMVLTDSPSIRDIILFPTMRPK